MGVQYGLDISSEAMTFQIYPFIRTVKLLHVQYVHVMHIVW